jgi:hypothetical protein
MNITVLKVEAGQGGYVYETENIKALNSTHAGWSFLVLQCGFQRKK